jgi:hypothetical protein
MNIYEISEEFHISLAKLRKMKQKGILRVDDSTTAGDLIRATLAKGNEPTAAQLVDLIEKPSLLLELGKYVDRAEYHLRKLANPQNQVAPKDVVANVMEAAKGETEAVLIMVDWLKSIIPTKPVGHAYVATRLLLGIPETIRKYEGPRIPRALLNARSHPNFAGWWRTEKQASRNVTLYQKLALDL